jgi:hypothetical protein
MLCLVSEKLLQIRKETELPKEGDLSIEDDQLTWLYLSNLSYQIRTPLNVFINYVEVAMEGALD